MLRTIALALALAFSTASFADVIDDNVAKAEKSVTNANNRLAKAKACQANREACLVDMKAKAQKSLERAQKKVSDLEASNQAE